MKFPYSLLLSLIGAAAMAAPPGSDLHLTYRSAADGTEQPYRLYVPAAYEAAREWPLVIALHGTGGNQDTLFDEYGGGGKIQQAAEESGTLLVSPFGRGATEFRGIGENDVLCVLEEVRAHYRVDPARIYVTGHSMGGTGAAYLALHHPDIFAAAAPLSAAYSFPWLARNAEKVPMLWVGGATDSPFYLRGVMIGLERMLKFGVPVTFELLPGQGHRGPVQDFGRIFRWLAQQKRELHPKAYTFEVDTPLHGRAWWTTVTEIMQPGRVALVRAEATAPDAVSLWLDNVKEMRFRPDPAVFDLSKPIAVTVNGLKSGPWKFGAADEFLFGKSAPALRPMVDESITAYRHHPVATAPEALTMEGTEKRLANWITDAMRSATGAEVALYNAVYYRGLPLLAGTVDVVDVIQCSRPFDEQLVTVKLTGRELRKILEDNLPDPKRDTPMQVDLPGAGQLVQVSGLRYAYDPRRPAGQRIVECDLDPLRKYVVVMESQALQRQTVRLAGRFQKLEYKTTEVPLSVALYGYAARQGVIVASAGGRVREVGAQ